MVFAICSLVVIVKFSTFVPKKIVMTQKDAIIEALKRLGGKANLNDIYNLSYKLADFSGSKDWRATIRWYLQKETDTFCSGKRGWWELVSFQEEIARRDRRIAELEAMLIAKNEEIAALRSVPTEDDFVKKFVKETKHFFKHDRKKADTVRQIMIKVGRVDADKDLDSWIDGKEQPTAAQAIEKQTEALLKVVERPTTQNINGDVVNGDKVAEKTIVPNVDNYKPTISNQHLNIPISSLGKQKQKLLENE